MLSLLLTLKKNCPKFSEYSRKIAYGLLYLESRLEYTVRVKYGRRQTSAETFQVVLMFFFLYLGCICQVLYFCIVSKLYPYYFRRYSISSRITFYEKIRGKFLKPTGFFLSWWFFLGLFLFFYFVSFFMIIFFCFIFSDSSQIEFRKT